MSDVRIGAANEFHASPPSRRSAITRFAVSSMTALCSKRTNKAGGIRIASHGCPGLRVETRALHETQPRRESVDGQQECRQPKPMS